MDKAYLDSINPKHHGDKYSENLYKWLNKHKDRPLFVAFSPRSDLDGSAIEYDKNKTQCSNIYIGSGDIDQGFVHGAKLSAIICGGTKTKMWANPPRLNFIKLPNWFDDYQAKGKCHIDPKHIFYPERWDTKEESRQCQWCGKKEKRVTHIVTRYSWAAV